MDTRLLVMGHIAGNTTSLVLMIALSACAAPETTMDEEPLDPDCWCNGAVPEGELDVGCGELQCVDGRGYLCTGPNAAEPDPRGCDPDAPMPDEELSAAECSDGHDNDADGATDCNDQGCRAHEFCDDDVPTENSEATCSDDDDNDEDGDVDCDDAGCASALACREGAAADISLGWTVLPPFVPGTTDLTTLISHLYGSTVFGARFNFLCGELTNNGRADHSVELQTWVTGYTVAPGASSVTLRPGETREVCANPDFNEHALNALASADGAQFHVDLIVDGEVVSGPAESIRVLPPNHFPWNYLHPAFAASLVKPTSPWVSDRQDDVAADSWTAGSFGAGGLGYATQVTRIYEPDIVDGEVHPIDRTFLKAGESFWVQPDTIWNRDDVTIIVRHGATEVLRRDGMTEGQRATMTASTAGWYHVFAHVPALAILNVTRLQFTRKMSRADLAINYLSAAFQMLRDEGVRYANISSIGSAQVIRSPADVGRGDAANCIEGSLVFASLLEQFGVRPAVVVSLANSHAIAGIYDSDGMLWPVETTAVGSASLNFWDALNAGVAANLCWTSDGSGFCTGSGLTTRYDELSSTLDIAYLRGQGVTPQPFD